MKFSIAACVATIVFVAMQAFISFVEGTFAKNRWITMGFINHGGMWGDLLLLPVVNGFLWPYLTIKGELLPISVMMFVNCVITVLIHWKWADWLRESETRGHMFNANSVTSFTLAGWLHVFYMTIQLTLLMLYVLSVIPPQVVWIISSVLTAHVFLGTVQPGWYCTGKVWTMGNIIPPTVCTALIWLIGVLKLRSV